MKKEKGNRTPQNATNLPGVDSFTGLTPLQEQAAIMLAAGESVTAVAEVVKVDRGTIYRWQRTVTFSCFLNQQAEENKRMLNDGLVNLTGAALGAIRQSLQSDNEAVRLKAAIWLVEKVNSMATGDTDAREVIKRQNTHTESLYDIEWEKTTFDEKQFQKDLNKFGLESFPE